MISGNKLWQFLRQPMFQGPRFATRASRRLFCDNNDHNESSKLPKISAVAQLAQSTEIETILEAPEPVQRFVELQNVRSKINELDQRELRHKEYAVMLKQLINKPTVNSMQPKLPFKQSASSNNMRQSLRNCSSMEEVLQLTDNPQELAQELVLLAWELSAEKRKNDVVLETYLELKQEMLHAKNKSS